MLTSSGRADVQIAGRGYQVATGPDAPQWVHRTIPLLRRQFDVSAEAGESSLNPEGPWRRTIDNWWRGAGQTDQDGTDARVGQFKDSRRADVWTKGEVRALPESEVVGGRANYMTTTSLGLYYLDDTGETLTRRADGVATSVALSTTTGSPRGLTSDGESVWYARTGATAGGVYRLPSDLSSETQIVTGALQGVEYVGDRLIAWSTTEVYDLSSMSYGSTPVALPTPLLTLKLPNQGWRCAAWGQGFIYLGTAGGHIYKTAVQPDGTALEVPAIAATLPSGEYPAAIYGYLGFVIVGTARGYRLAIPDADGSLTLGATIEIMGTSANPAIVGRGRFVYVTSNGSSPAMGSGVRRIDLSVLNDTQPAHAPDLWFDISTNVNSVGFDVAGFGREDLHFGTTAAVYREASTLADDGWVETGEIDFGLSSNKVVKGITADVGAGSVTFTIYDDEGAEFPVGVATPDLDTISIPNDVLSRSFRVRATLSSDAVLRSFTLLAFPTGVHTDEITVPLVIAERQHLRSGDQFGSPQAPLSVVDGRLSTTLADDLEFLKGLRDSGNFINYLEGETAHAVQVTTVGYLPHQLSRDRRSPAGIAVVTMKTSGVLGSSTDPVVPSQVGTPGVLAGDTQLTVSWDEPFSGGDTITSYDVRYSANAGSTWTEVSAGLALSDVISSLANGTEYLVGVRAVNALGDGPWSPSVAGTPAGLPDAPTSLAVTG